MTSDEQNAPETPSAPRFFIVNDSGTIHEVTEDDLHRLVKEYGWREATADDLQRLADNQGMQPFVV